MSTRNLDRALVKQKTFSILNPIKRATRDGVFKMSENSMEKYKSNLYTLVFTGVGERVMRPEFGTRITQLLFEPLGDQLYVEIKREIVDKAKTWIPQIKIVDVEFKNIEAAVENNRIDMKIKFALKNDETIQDFIEIEMGA
jgi:phage baseplate assembly protein W